jgi:small subunit ribosomal protein S15
MKNSDSKGNIEKVRRHSSDVGSPEAQIAIKTGRLELLSTHLAAHPNDVHSRRGMRKLVSDRNADLSYLKRENPESYKNVITTLGLRK